MPEELVYECCKPEYYPHLPLEIRRRLWVADDTLLLQEMGGPIMEYIRWLTPTPTPSPSTW